MNICSFKTAVFLYLEAHNDTLIFVLAVTIFFYHYKNIEKTCINHHEIYQHCQLEYKSHGSILRLLLFKTFSKVFSSDESNKLKVRQKFYNT